MEKTAREVQLCQICLHQCRSGQSHTGWKTIYIYLDRQKGRKLAHKGPAHSHTIPSQTAFVSKANTEYLDRECMAHKTENGCKFEASGDLHGILWESDLI